MSGLIEPRVRDHDGISTKAIAVVFSLVAAVTVMVMAIVATGNGVERDTVHGFRTIASVKIDRTDGGALAVRGQANPAMAMLVYPPGPNQYLAGALRSINRMNGVDADHLSSGYEIRGAGRSIVFLRDADSGNEINLNAFGEAATQEFITALGKRAEQGG